ncbi:Uncharacterised protein [Yersinia pseudotuberculosis]|nr:hypothetical protein BZ23_3012 [Yersinia pseudotuberculosis]CNK50137.1 Uncharacterised protein [Yersinia pseudotuberculosis]SUP87362.1 Uncharacterised protein [Yersinia pseudotuberculosis]
MNRRAFPLKAIGIILAIISALWVYNQVKPYFTSELCKDSSSGDKGKVIPCEQLKKG